MKTTKPTGRGVLTTLMIILCVGSVSRAAVASTITQPTETLPGQKIEKVFDTTGFDRVNIFSGDLQLTVPLGPEYPVTAGFSFQLAAHYSSKYWHMVKLECGSTDTCGTDWAARANVIQGVNRWEGAVQARWGLTPVTDRYGNANALRVKVKIPAWDGGTAKLMRKVTWYGANPAPVLSGSGRFTGGADCAEAVETACWQGTASGWHNQAREFTMWTTERASESGSSALLFPSDFVRREEKTEYTPDMSLWDLKRVTYSGVKDVYSTGSGCKAEVEPCEMGTVYSHDVVSQSDPSYVLAKKGSSYPCALSEDAAAEGGYEACQYDGFGRLERTVTRYPVSGGSAFAVRKRTYGAHGAVTFQSERSHCTSGESPLPCFTANPLTGTSYSDFDAFSRPLKEESGDGYWLKRAYGVNAHGFVDTDMYEWRERTKEASSERYVMSARRTGVFGNVLILAAPVFTPTDEDLTLGQLSFLYWNTQGKLTRTETLASQAPAQGFPDRPNLGETGSQRRSWHYDASGLLREESCPEKGWTEYLSYDAMGNLLEKTEGGIWSGYHYDAASRLTREEASATGGEEGAVTLTMKTWDTPPGKLTEELAYNPSLDVRYGTSASFWNPGLGTPGTVAVRETYTYSPVSGKLTSRKVTSETGTEYGYRKTGALAATESYGYNALGYVTSETRTGNGWGMGLVEEKSFRYGVPVSVRVKPSDQTAPQAIVTDAAYGPGGALSSYTLGNGSQVSVATDGRNRPVSIVGAGFDSGEMSYDGDGNLKKMGELTYGYDASSRLTSVKEGTLTRETMQYDSFGNLTSRSNGWMGTTEALPASLETNRLVSGTYDDRGNLLTMGTETFRYDVAGRKYEYEASGTKMRYLFGPGDERSGKIVLESGEDGGSRRMMARQLIQALGAAPAANCNPAGLTFLDVPCHDPDWGYIQTLYDLRITGGCGNYRSYCPNDLVTREQMAVFIMVVKYFPEPVPDPTINPAWQDDPPASSWALKFINRMYQEGITAGCEANPLRFCPKHELKRWQLEIFLTVIVPRLVSLKPSTSYTLRDSGNRVVTEYQDTVRTRDNIYFGNQLMASLRWSWDARTRTWGKAWEYYGSDHLGTPRTVQDALGNLVDRKDYLAFGELRSGPPPSQRKGFALMERDDEGSGKSFYDHARDYHSRLCRFTSPDLLQGTATDPLSWNRYAYARNNPLRYVDRDGRDFQDFMLGMGNALKSNHLLGVGRMEFHNSDSARGQIVGDAASAILGPLEIFTGGAAAAAGGGLALSGGGAVASPAMIAGGVGLASSGASATVNGVMNLFAASSEGGGGKTGRKVSRDARESGEEKIDALRKEVAELDRKPNKTPADKAAQEAKERELKRAIEKRRASEEHARQEQK